MRTDLRLSPWSVSGTGNCWDDVFLESIFFLGNGRMGIRGYIPMEPEDRPIQKGVYLAGIFGEIKPGITDFVNLPTPVYDSILLDGEAGTLSSPIERSLDMKAACFTARFSLTAKQKTVDVVYSRFLPKEHPALILQRLMLIPHKNVEISVASGLMTDSCNSPIPDDQTKENKGCYFWDTDLFMLPFFLKNDLQAAKSLCDYRARSLPAAKEHSKRMNTAGARYPWMAALDGSEQCETWDIGCSELHVTADVAYALDAYCKASGDSEFYLEKAAEVYIETAHFWVSRYTYRPELGRADLLFCKGPDEYCGITNNNLFTNVMVQHNLTLAIQAAADLFAKRPERYRALGLSTAETEHMAALRDAIPWPHDPITGHLAQDETLHLLEPVDPVTLKPDAGASYHHVCFDRLQRYKVIKQADVLLLMTRLPQLFTAEEKRAAWKDFEPICLHDSTLSFASHALFALQNGLTEQGMDYLKKALLLDLRDVMGNTGHEGLHLACMGEAWQAAECLTHLNSDQ